MLVLDALVDSIGEHKIQTPEQKVWVWKIAEAIEDFLESEGLDWDYDKLRMAKLAYHAMFGLPLAGNETPYSLLGLSENYGKEYGYDYRRDDQTWIKYFG